MDPSQSQKLESLILENQRLREIERQSQLQIEEHILENETLRRRLQQSSKMQQKIAEQFEAYKIRIDSLLKASLNDLQVKQRTIEMMSEQDRVKEQQLLRLQKLLVETNEKNALLMKELHSKNNFISAYMGGDGQPTVTPRRSEEATDSKREESAPNLV